MSIMDFVWDNLKLMTNGSFPFDYEDVWKEMRSNVTEEDRSQYMRDLLTYYVMGIGGMCVCAFGLVGNCLSLIVLTRRTMHSSTYSYLSALAACDTVVLLFTIILLVKDVNKPVLGQQRWPWDEGIYPYLFPYTHAAAFSFQVTSIWLTLAFTVDRYIMIVYPFKAEPFCNISRARKVIVCLYIGSLLFNIPKFFEYETLDVPLPHNTTKVGCDLTDFGRSPLFRELYHSWFYIVFVCGVPFLTLAVLNAFLMHAVHLSRIRGKEINAAERKRNDTTIMLIGVVVVFFICQMPALVSRMIWAFEHDTDAFKSMPLHALNEIGNFLIILNSAINIVPYYFFGKRFRKQFWKLFCHCLLSYKQFQKMSRSLSLTVMEGNRRVSGASAQQQLVRKNTDTEETFEKNRKDSVLTVPTNDCYRKPSMTSESANSGGQNNQNSQGGASAAGYQRLSKASEVNGNCIPQEV